MFALQRDGKINTKFPGDYDRSLKDKSWYCSNCHDLAHTNSIDIFYDYNTDFVHHRHADGRIYPCKEFCGFNEEGKSLWINHIGTAIEGKPLRIGEKDVIIPLDLSIPGKIKISGRLTID